MPHTCNLSQGVNMTIQGHVRNGIVVPDREISLPDGAVVEIRLLDEQKQDTPLEKQTPTLYDALGDLVGSIKDAPEDFASNHDHYAHGGPKRQ
ncbi:MAG: hypothetical protein K1X53_06910 [Candidatus Sumerlaeaceae bacterium]|nr:hypothetical protein [Candidatus Sumerlaeaceae bacterium]